MLNSQVVFPYLKKERGKNGKHAIASVLDTELYVSEVLSIKGHLCNKVIVRF